VPDARLEPVPVDFARGDAAAFLAPPVERDEVVPELRGDPVLDRLEVEREPELDDDLRAPLERAELARDDEEADPPELPLPLDPSVGDHFPDMTRWAASATASAMIEPSLVALDTTLLAARSAVSAASSPASRIFLRAAGLALIAAAAAARPAASISLLIAALASLSTVVWFDRVDDEPPLDDDEAERDGDERVREGEDLLREELLRVDLAIVFISLGRGKDTSRPFRFPNEVEEGAAHQM
jgi:hypothetical protein